MTDRAPVAIVPGRLGILGGTFDPIHVGHLAVAEEAREALGLERILFVPAAVPPHKLGRAITLAEDRLAMVELAIAHNPAFVASRVEFERGGPSYTVDTLVDLDRSERAAGREPDLILVMSAEAFHDLPTWREPARVLQLARLAVAPRDGYPDAEPGFLARNFPGFEDRAIFLDAPRLRLSASDLRERAACGRSLRYLVPDAVATYIGDHDLYSDPVWRND
jgi:nicotinate-nucleotide adenylyltransferase